MSVLFTRRRMLVATGAAAAGLAIEGLLGPVGRAAAATTSAFGTPVEDAVRATLKAYASTLVPGPDDDPDGAPGAVEAEAVEQLEAQVAFVVPPLIADLDGAALAAHGRTFAALSYPEREAIVVAAFADPVRAPLHLIALAVAAGSFYGDFRNRVGGTYIGFPGASDGYLDRWTDRTGHGQPQRDAVPS